MEILYTDEKRSKRFRSTNKKEKIKIKADGNSPYYITGTLVFLLLATLIGFWSFNYKNLDFAKAFVLTFENIGAMFFQSRISNFTLAEALHGLAITVSLGFLTTLISAWISLLFGLLAANNLSKPWLSTIIKGVVSFIRAVPTVLWVLIFAISAGLGSVAAIIGTSFHSVGYLVKAYSEVFEEIDSGVIEALKASGASWWQIVFQAVIPSTSSYLMSWTLMRFEINFMVAIAMGAAAGAGGIGFDLFMSGNFYYNIREVGFITYLVLAAALLFEFTSTRLKTKLLS